MLPLLTQFKFELAMVDRKLNIPTESFFTGLAVKLVLAQQK